MDFRLRWLYVNKILNKFNKYACKIFFGKMRFLTVSLIPCKMSDKNLNTKIWLYFFWCDWGYKIWAVYFVRQLAVQFWCLFEQKKYPYMEPIFDFHFWVFKLYVFCMGVKEILEQKNAIGILGCNLRSFDDLNVQLLHFLYEKKNTIGLTG